MYYMYDNNNKLLCLFPATGASATLGIRLPPAGPSSCGMSVQKTLGIDTDGIVHLALRMTNLTS